jgi:hypothetical protein
MQRLHALRTVAMILGVWMFLVGCGTVAKGFDPAASPNPETYGYHIEPEVGEVLFYFQPGFVESVTADGPAAPTSANNMTITSVTIAGPFTGWDRYAWPLTQEGKIWTLRKPVAEIGQPGEAIPFKFVVNGDLWVEPPTEALNRADAGMGNNSYNWVVQLP